MGVAGAWGLSWVPTAPAARTRPEARRCFVVGRGAVFQIISELMPEEIFRTPELLGRTAFNTLGKWSGSHNLRGV